MQCVACTAAHTVYKRTAAPNAARPHHTTGLSALPDTVGKLTALQTLDLSGNQLSALPDAVGKLTALQILDLNDNQLSALPDAVGRLTALQFLHLNSNQLSALPDAVGRLTALQTLDLRRQPAQRTAGRRRQADGAANAWTLAATSSAHCPTPSAS